jgi:hypothetical protein
MLPVIVFSAFIGGAFHAVLSIRKYDLSKGRLSSVVVDGVIGIVTGMAFLSFVTLTGNAGLLATGLAGYVGADVVNSLITVKMRRISVHSPR